MIKSGRPICYGRVGHVRWIIGSRSFGNLGFVGPVQRVRRVRDSIQARVVLLVKRSLMPVGCRRVLIWIVCRIRISRVEAGVIRGVREIPSRAGRCCSESGAIEPAAMIRGCWTRITAMTSANAAVPPAAWMPASATGMASAPATGVIGERRRKR